MLLILITVAVIADLTAVSAQDADTAALIKQLTKSEQALPQTFSHEFRHGLPADLFPGPRWKTNSIGLPMVLKAKDGWAGKAQFAQIRLTGDFDIEASFTGFESQGEENSTILLSAHFDDASQSKFRVIRMRNQSGKGQAEVSLSQQADEKRNYRTTSVTPCEFRSGRLRISRRGNEIHHLIAEGDDGDWIFLGSNSIDAVQTAPRGISLETGCNGTTSTKVIWQRLTVRAADMQQPRQTVAMLDRSQPGFSAVFEYDFRHGCSEEYFSMSAAVRTRVLDRPDGLLISARGEGPKKWGASEISSCFEVAGDFDIEAEFEKLVKTGDESGCVLLSVQLADEQRTTCRSIRMDEAGDRKIARGSLIRVVNGKRNFTPADIAPETSTHGRLRLCRRGAVMHVLYAAGDSDDFRLLSSRSVPENNTAVDGIKFRTTAIGASSVSAIWKRLTIRADRLLYHNPKSGQRQLASMNSDGTDLKVLTGPPADLNHLGSPEFSPDASTIVFDASMGGTDTSRVTTIQADGSGMTNLGPGCMPSFSGDGQQLVFSENNYGIIQMDRDGAGRIRLDASGWGSHWSPDGRHIAWGSSNNITMMNVRTEERQAMLNPRAAARLRQIYWNMAWSNDAKFIAFKAKTKQGKDVLAFVDLAGEGDFSIMVNGSVNSDLSWNADGTKVLFSRLDTTTKLRSLFTVTRGTPHQIAPVPGPPADWKIFDCDWSHDGSRIVFSAVVPPQPIDWPIEKRQP